MPADRNSDKEKTSDPVPGRREWVIGGDDGKVKIPVFLT